ncbi:MAG TPA: hypothetical protein VGE97_00885 [Nitrososphaera sp.]
MTVIAEATNNKPEPKVCNVCRANGHRMIIHVAPFVDSITKVTKNRLYNFHSGTRHYHLTIQDRGSDFD